VRILGVVRPTVDLAAYNAVDLSEKPQSRVPIFIKVDTVKRRNMTQDCNGIDKKHEV
jgi:hypothetical protein